MKKTTTIVKMRADGRLAEKSVPKKRGVPRQELAEEGTPYQGVRRSR